MSIYPFCKRDPYHYVDVGTGIDCAVAIDCCDLGMGLWAGEKWARQTLRLMRSPSPRHKARAMKTLRECGVRA